MLNIELRKGDPQHLDGRVTVYAAIDIDPADLLAMKHPIASAVHNGFLVAQGNFRDQNSLKDFLRSEIGLSSNEDLGEGLSELVDRMSGIESALDPQKLKDRLDNMGDFEEFIPTPAKVLPFHSEREILAQDGDVFYTGTFKNIGNAVLSINAVPIVYQARYREQEMQQVRNEIESLISQVEDAPMPVSSLRETQTPVEEKMLKDLIPAMLYSKGDAAAFKKSCEQFYAYLSTYPYPEDVQNIVRIITVNDVLHDPDSKLLELYAKKIGAVSREDFSAADHFATEIRKFIS